MDLTDPTHGSPTTSLAFFAVAGLLTASQIVKYPLEAWLLRRQAKIIRGSVARTEPLRAGEAVVHGEVTPLGENDVVARTVLGQSLVVRPKKSPVWREISRVTEATPFALVHHTGEAVHVEPGSNVLVVDELGPPESVSDTYRRRVSTITRGERVYVAGTLRRGAVPVSRLAGGGYREHATEGWILGPTGKRRMTLSVEPLDARYEQRAGFLLRSMWLWCVFLLVVGYVNRDFLTALVDPRPATVEATSPAEWTVKVKNGRTNHVGVIVAGADGVSRRFELDDPAYREIAPKTPGSKLDALASRSGATLFLGTRPTLPIAVLMLLPFAFLALAFLIPWWFRVSVQAWYDRPVEEEASKA